VKKLFKKKIIFLLFFFAFLFPSVALGAVNVIEQTGSIFSGSPYLDSANNRYTVDFVGENVTKITLQSWNDDFSVMGNEVTVDAVADGYTHMVGNNFTCNVPYKAYYYDSANNQIGFMQLVVSGLTEPALCDSGGSGAIPPPIEDCASVVCECIEQLKEVLHGDNISTGVKLDELASIGNQIKNEIGSLHDEFQTDIDYSAKPISNGGGGVSPMPDVTNILEQNKPVQNNTPYKNDEIIFSDGGTAETPGALPKPPDVKDWDGFLPETALPPEAEQVKQGQLISDVFNSDDEMTKDVSSQDAEMTKDDSVKDAEMTKDDSVKDAEMIKDATSQDAEMNKEIFTIEPIMSAEQMQSTDSYGKTHVYEQTNVFP
jgi:hypothetical protein